MPVSELHINDLKNAHWDLFKELVKGANFRVNLARQFGLKSKAFLDFNVAYVPLVINWITRENEMEDVFYTNTRVKGIIYSGDLKAEDFFISASLPKLEQIINNPKDYYANVKLT